MSVNLIVLTVASCQVDFVNYRTNVIVSLDIVSKYQMALVTLNVTVAVKMGIVLHQIFAFATRDFLKMSMEFVAPSAFNVAVLSAQDQEYVRVKTNSSLTRKQNHADLNVKCAKGWNAIVLVTVRHV